MFESGDWDLDQDVLNDADDKAVKYLFQKDSQAVQCKKRKIENNDNSLFSSECDSNIWGNTFNKTAIKHDKTKQSRKNLIMGLFNKNSPGKNVSNNMIKSYENISINNSNQNCQENQLLENNLVLGILKNKNIQANVIESNTKNAEVRKAKADTKINNNGNINIQKGHRVLNNKVENKTVKSNYETEINSKQCSSKNSKRQLLCDVLKQKSMENIQSKNNLKSTLPALKPLQVQPHEKMTLIRKFPGPAGLLPDNIDFNIPCLSYLYSLEESEKAKEDPNSKNLPEYCSQNTKNLFSEGAWQNMLDDLPSGFLKGCDIATVKQTATLNGFNGTKIKFLAGIIEHIDFSHDNPPIVLKDFTDSIQGIVHRDIPLKHPGVLEANVVVLLHDVGLLRTSGAFVSNKYQILISPSNLLAIYTSNGIIEHTEHLQSVFRYISEGKTEKERGYSCTQLVETDSSSNSYPLNARNNSNSKEQTNFSNIKKESNKKKDNIINKSLEFDTDIHFSVLPINAINSPTQLNCISSVAKDKQDHIIKKNEKRRFVPIVIEKKNENNYKDIENVLKSSKGFAPSIENHLCHNVITSVEMDAGHSGSTSIHFRENELKLLNHVTIENMNFDENNAVTPVEVKSITVSHNSTNDNKYEVMHKNNTATIHFQLQQLKSVNTSNALKDFAIKKDEKPQEEKRSEALNSVQNTLCVNENDSDDEIFSQLDIDTIFSNYNKTS